MNVGIISMQRVKNYGSLLQAFALKRFLEKRGHTVQFIDIESKNIEIEGLHSLPKSLLKKIRLVDKYLFKRVIFSRRNMVLNRLFVSYQQKYLNLLSTPMDCENCDAVIIGSDEIFNCASDSVWGVSGQRFGDIAGIEIAASYAASCGQTNIEDANDEDKTIMAAALHKMRGISVRDENTHLFVKALTGIDANYNLDPVLIYDFDDSLCQNVTLPHEPYMIVYAYHNRISSSQEIEAIKKYARKNKLKTISIGGSLPWCDDFAVLDPFEVLEYFKNAACVVTDTFHGTIISAKFNKSAAILIRDSNANKLLDLTNRLQINSKIVKKACDIGAVLDKGNEGYDACNAIITKGKEAATAYFDSIGL